MDEFSQYTPRQIFGIARACFEENCTITLKNKDKTMFNLNRGLLALVEAGQRELDAIGSDVGRIPR